MSDYIDLLARNSDLKDTSKDLLARKKDLNTKYTPLSIENNGPSWMTPDFNPNMEDTFKPYSFIKLAGNGLSLPTTAGLIQEGLYMPDTPQTKPLPFKTYKPDPHMDTKGMVQLPNGRWITQEQWTKLQEMLKNR